MYDLMIAPKLSNGEGFNECPIMTPVYVEADPRGIIYVGKSLIEI
jgi:hypothetical protein